MSDALQDYLDELAGQLNPDGVRLRRLLAETEDHLRETVERLEQDGLDHDTAMAAAVDRFGSAETVARTMRSSRRALVTDGLRTLWLLAGIGLLAIGASGVLAFVFGVTAGTQFVAGDGFGVTYTAERCADFLEYFPTASSCNEAAAFHHADEIVSTRWAAGVLGLLVLGAYIFYTRRHPRSSKLVPRGTTSVVAAVVFGVVGLALALLAAGTWIGEATHNEAIAGVGAPLSDALMSLTVALAASILALRQVATKSN